MGEFPAQKQDSSEAACIVLATWVHFLALSVRSLHVLPVTVCVPSRCFGFLLSSKDTRVSRLIDHMSVMDSTGSLGRNRLLMCHISQ